jgi:outer membrane protein assembly factor BamA
MPPKAVPDNSITAEEVRLEGFDVLPTDARDALRDDLPIRAGAPLTSEIEKAAGERAVETLQNHGYPYAQVALVREPIDAARTRVTLRADPGAIGFFGPVNIAGNRRVDDRVIRSRLGYAPGDLFRRSAIEYSQQRLGTLGLFKSVEIRADDIDARPAVVPTLITVEERTPWHWNVGAGYAAGERLAVDARISHLNVFGSAERFDLQGRLSRIERTAEAGFTQSDTWHPALSLSLLARHQEIDEQAFSVLSRGGQLAASWQWAPDLSSTVSYAVSREESDVDPALGPLLGLQDGMLSAWSLDVLRRAESARPTGSLSLHVEQAGGWMPGTFNYFSLVGDARRYRRALDDRIVFAGRVRAGSIDPRGGEADIPLLKRFFLGGSNEMRGWGVYELSPLSASGEPVGGVSLLTATAEARFPIFTRVRGTIFVEAGNVWQDPWTMRLGDLRYDAGPGLRFDTPFGLVRIDFGYQLRPLDGLHIDGQPQTSRWRFNLGIGEAF